MGLSDLLATVAIIISVVSALYQWYFDSRINRINLEADNFRELYSEHLLHKIPKARRYIRFSNGKLLDIDDMLEELNEIRIDSLYFKYADENFYNALKEKLQKFEDYLVYTGNEQLSDSDEKMVMENIQNYLTELYKLFTGKYIGKKSVWR